MPGVELFKPDLELIRSLQAAKLAGHRVIAVGTTVVRALESMVRLASNSVSASSDLMETNLFITPGFEFQICDAIVTNFHQPRTTHLLLVESFMGLNNLSAAYAHALNNQYRFLSYGDGMLII